MPYIPTVWSNETPASTPIKYTITDDDLGEIAASATIAAATSITPGTPLDSTNLNKMEEGIRAAMEEAEALVGTSKLVDGLLSADTPGRAKMADGFVTLAKLSADLRFQKIYEFVADGSSLMDWTSIPQTFRNLVMIYNGISSRATAGWDDIGLQVNGDTGSNYHDHVFSLDTLDGQTYNHFVTNPHGNGLHAGALPAQNAGYLPSGSGLVLFPNYSGSAFYKSALQFSFYTGSYAIGALLVNSYRTNAEAITRLTGKMSTGLYPRAGSVFSLYAFN
jgi:hypothetical protein